MKVFGGGKSVEVKESFQPVVAMCDECKEVKVIRHFECLCQDCYEKLFEDV